MIDEQMMKLALQLAQAAEGQTSPNPLVGAVCVKEGQVIGTGFHTKAGTPHAEVHALQMAAKDAFGADLYVTLEPCAHVGRTKPCTSLIIERGISRVIIATKDPNPLVSGKGIAQLEEAGIEVIQGVLQKEAQYLNRAFFHYIQYGKPYVTLKAATTLDGRLASSEGDSKWITTSSARQDVHKLRHTHDAILVGIETVLHDNPFLTTRLPHGGKNPIRIILDRQLRINSSAHVISDGAAETIIFTQAEFTNIDHFQSYKNVSVEWIAHDKPFLETVLQTLAQRNIVTLFVEGGSRIHSSFIQEQLADELYVYIAPKLLGNGPSLFENHETAFIQDSEKLKLLDVQTFDGDIRVHASFVKESDHDCSQE